MRNGIQLASLSVCIYLLNISIARGRLLSFSHHEPEAPPPPDDPPPPEKLLRDPLLPELQVLPELPEEKTNPPIDALPFVRMSSFTFLYQADLLMNNLTAGKPIR